MMGEQKGNDVELICEGGIALLKDCNVLKLFRTLYDKSGEQYTEEEMNEWDLARK